ncbi:metallophosphoesterase [Taibaiella koreensis]|uniref:metallophosphoesterase n=1 Tax=Taibaiella koreensis TaxID=1268548 RepID=UPI000E59C9CD|nr:metallophosphoesterase [Taibaiella koreensis]
MKYIITSLFLLGVLGYAGTARAQTITLNRSVATGSDDAEECVPGGTGGTVGAVDLASTDLEIMLDGPKKQMIGLRFTNITIPPGSVIQNAYIQFSTKGDKNPVLGNAYLSIQDADNPATFGGNFNITSRARIADSVLWPGSTSSTWGTSSAGVAGPDQKTPELKTLVQAVINRSGWVSGNALVFFITGPDGVRNANSYDNPPLGSGAAKLVIQYTSSVVPQIPVTAFPIAKLSQWKYLDNGSNQDTAWRMPSFNDSSWSFGPGKLGYSDNPATTLSYGPNSGNKYITYYFRKPFTVSNLAGLSDSLDLNILRDDGAVVFINGVEVVRSNMDPGTYDYLTHSSTIVDGADESTYFHYSVPKSVLVNGNNLIAVEIHQRDGTSSDLGFDMELIEHVPPAGPSLLRGPYLNAATPNSIVIRWRTDLPAKSRVRFGATAAQLDQVVQDTNAVTEHIIKLTGLTPYTRYFYSIGSLTDTLQGDAANYFSTLPVAGLTDSLIRIGVIGDCGNNSTNQRNVRDQLVNYLGQNYMNAWILLGDNAYSSGFDNEYQAEFFNIYKDRFLKQNPLFPAPGNHDYGNSTSSPSVTNHALAPYYQNFTMPVAGEAGGTPSNNPAFYSYDVGNMHFLSLDSYGKEADASLMYDTNGVQVQWIKQDLANNTNKGWVVAYWHHPPYTMGSHNSDNEGDLVQIRQKFIQILERMGVDLILCGHSHDYERSKLMKGHYGNEASFDANVHHLSASSGMYDGSANSCPYVKDSATNYQGTVYVVSGSAGQLGGQQGSFPHNAMYYSNASNGGSMILEVKGNRLDAKWICADGVIRDQFTMMKDANRKRTYEIDGGSPVTLKAAYNGVYNWQGVAANTQSVTVSPTDTTTYVVTDNFSCISDTFVVQARAVPLPVSWGYMRASVKDAHSNLVVWQTLSEHNTAYFEVERAMAAGAFTAVGKVKAAGNSSQSVNYQLADATIDPTQSLYLYRVRQVDLDGKVTYSQVVPVSRNGNEASTLILAPNPAHDGEMIIALTKGGEVAAELLLSDVAGRKVWRHHIMLSGKPQPFLPSLQQGIYFLTVKYEGGSFTRKIVIK